MTDKTKNYITPRGAAQLKKELHQLLTVDRPALVQTVSWAASNGDRSENADYIYGKRRLREIDRRVRFLTQRLEAAVIIDPATQNSDRVLFGATVTIQNEEEIIKKYTIVGADEIEASQGRVSWASPMAKVLLNARVGDWVTLISPKGKEDLEILKIEYIAQEPY